MEKKSCCNPVSAPVRPATTKVAFLDEKLRNFREYLIQFATTPEMVAELQRYQSVEEVLPLLAQSVPVVKAGQVGLIADGFCTKFQTTDEAFRLKVARYMECFVETLLS